MKVLVRLDVTGYLEAASTGLAACLRAPSNDFPAEFVLSCCLEAAEAEDLAPPLMAEDWADIVLSGDQETRNAVRRRRNQNKRMPDNESKTGSVACQEISSARRGQRQVGKQPDDW